MRRLTFGVTCSPFLATEVLRKVAEEYKSDYPEAAKIISTSFYVDDVLTGAPSTQEGMVLHMQLNDLLSKAAMLLRKWRSNSATVLESLPAELREKEDIHLSPDTQPGPKILRIHWNAKLDNMFVSIPNIVATSSPTKREVASTAAKIYDLLGWTVKIKMLLQNLWEADSDWDQTISGDLVLMWQQWCQELPLLKDKGILRTLYHRDNEIRDIQLHGLSDGHMVEWYM